MVEFIRDVIVVVAILATLIAFAFHPAPESEAARHSDVLTGRISVSGSIGPPNDAAIAKSTGTVPR